MRKISRRSGSGLVGAAIAGVLVTASVSWACAPLVGPQADFVVTSASNPANDSVSPGGGMTVAGWLSGLYIDMNGSNLRKLYLGAQVSGISNVSPIPTSNDGDYCKPTGFGAAIDNDMDVRKISSDLHSYLRADRYEIDGSATMPVGTLGGTYMLCSGARYDVWWDTITVL